MKKIIIISVLLTVFVNCFSQNDSLYYIDKEYEIVQIDTIDLYKQYYKLDSIGTILDYICFGTFVGTGISSFAFKIAPDKMLIPMSAIFTIWIGQRVYIFIKTKRIEKQILKARKSK